MGFGYNEILLFLLNCHGIHMSLRNLHRVLRRENVSREKRKIWLTRGSTLNSKGASWKWNNVGYRSTHQRVITHGLKIDRESVRLGLKGLDPHGVSYHAIHRLKKENMVHEALILFDIRTGIINYCHLGLQSMGPSMVTVVEFSGSLSVLQVRALQSFQRIMLTT